MALINCDECRKEFSDKANACPNCGCPNENLQIQEKKENIKMQEPIEPPFEIKGDEKRGWQSFGPITSKLMKLNGYAFIGLIIWSIYNGVENNKKYDMSNLLGDVFAIFILFSMIALILSILTNITPRASRKRKEASQIFEYFKLKYPFLSEMKPEYKSLGIINLNGKDIDGILYVIYMEAFKKKADAIVINNNSVITHVGTSVTPTLQRNVSSSTSREIMATFVKY